MYNFNFFLLLLLIPFGTTEDTPWRIFDYKNLQTFNISNLSPILHPPSFIQLAAEYGFSAEAYEVTTEDGYILTLFRIPGSQQTLPVLIFHGLMESADTWIIRGEVSLAVTLANAKYDVWLGNVRGNRYSRGHVVLNADVDPTYWDFSFDQYGLFDLASSIDLVLNKTGAPKLNLIGHSQGTVMMWSLFSTRLEFNDKVNVAIALAPIAYLQYVQPPLSIIIRISPAIYAVLRALRVVHLFGDNSVETLAVRAISQIPVIGYIILIYGVLFPLVGFDREQLEPSFLTTLTSHFPTWTSLKNLAQYAQVALTNVFKRFDYGEAGNLVAYNQTTPPLYNFGNISTKVVLIAALNDKLATVPDLDHLRRQLPNVVRNILIPRLVTNHIDFTWGRDAIIYAYSFVLQVLKKYN